jgi:hypothetical protein
LRNEKVQHNTNHVLFFLTFSFLSSFLPSFSVSFLSLSLLPSLFFSFFLLYAEMSKKYYVAKCGDTSYNTCTWEAEARGS